MNVPSDAVLVDPMLAAFGEALADADYEGATKLAILAEEILVAVAAGEVTDEQRSVAAIIPVIAPFLRERDRRLREEARLSDARVPGPDDEEEEG